MVFQIEVFQKWSQINSGERFYVNKDHSIAVVGNKKISLIDRILGRSRLSYTLSKIENYLDTHKDELGKKENSATLSALVKKIAEMQGKYTQKHSRLYRFIFGRNVFNQCQQIKTKIERLISTGSDHRVPFNVMDALQSGTGQPVLKCIMSFLTPSDLNKAALVSKEWRDPAREAKILWINSHPEVPLGELGLKSFSGVLPPINATQICEKFKLHVELSKFSTAALRAL